MIEIRENWNQRDVWLARLFISVIIIKGANMTFSITEILPRFLEVILLGLAAAFYAVSLLENFRYTVRRINPIICLFVFLFTLMYVLSFGAYPQYSSYIIKRFIWTVPLGLSCFYSLLNVKDTKILFDNLFKYSFIITIFGTLVFFGDTGTLSSNMSFSAMMLFPFAVHVAKIGSSRKKGLIYLLCLYELVIIFSHGSRGGLLYAILFSVLFVVVKNRRNMRKMRKLIVILFAFFFVGIVFLLNLDWLSDELSKHHLYIRNIDFLMQGKFLDDNGRFEVYSKYLNSIFSGMPVRFSVLDSNNFRNNYPHNVFIEIMYDFGYLLGTILVVLFLSASIKKVLSKKGDDLNILMILFGAGLLPLLTSFTYLEWPVFWALSGFLCNSCHTKVSRYKLNYEGHNETGICS